MPDRRHAALLLEMAKKDLKAVGNMLAPEAFDDEVFGFHCQQAAEKALKAWLCLVDVEYHRIHDLGELLSALAEKTRVPARFEDLVDWNAFAVQHRYLPFGGELDAVGRERMVRQAQELVEHVAGALERTP